MYPTANHNSLVARQILLRHRGISRELCSRAVYTTAYERKKHKP